jgi:diguanylate cyclase (GGDEF)-like protein
MRYSGHATLPGQVLLLPRPRLLCLGAEAPVLIGSVSVLDLMSLATVAAFALGLTVVLLLAWNRRSREDLRLLRRQTAALEVERGQVVRFLAALTSAASRLYASASEREIPTVLLDTAVEALAPAAALVAVRRKRSSGPGQRWVVAAVHPREASALIGSELSWAEVDAGPRSDSAPGVIRRGQAGMPRIVTPGQPLTTAPELALEWAAPMAAENAVVGIIAISASASAPDLAEAMLGALARSGAIAFNQIVARQRTRTSAQVDELTLLFNRRHILRVLAEEIRRSQQHGHELSVFLFDIDPFTRSHDFNGHMSGDVLLRLLAEAVLKNVRASDTVGRFGGEEFLVILPHTAAGQAVRVANGLRALISNHDFPARSQQPLGAVTVSGGVAQFPVHGASVSTLLRAADQALYSAKHAGRNCVVCADVAPLDVHYESPDLEEELD